MDTFGILPRRGLTQKNTVNTSHPLGFSEPPLVEKKHRGKFPEKKQQKRHDFLPGEGGVPMTTSPGCVQVDRFNPDNQVSLPEAELMAQAGAMAKKAGRFLLGLSPIHRMPVI